MTFQSLCPSYIHAFPIVYFLHRIFSKKSQTILISYLKLFSGFFGQTKSQVLIWVYNAFMMWPLDVFPNSPSTLLCIPGCPLALLLTGEAHSHCKVFAPGLENVLPRHGSHLTAILCSKATSLVVLFQTIASKIALPFHSLSSYPHCFLSLSQHLYFLEALTMI